MAWRWSVCGTAEVVWKPRFLWQWPSGHLHCWVWCLSSSTWQDPIDSLWVQVRRVCWPIKHSNTMVIEPAFGTFGSVGRCQILLENEISFIKRLVFRDKLYLHKACQQKEAWSALKFPGRWLRWLWTSENTVYQHQQMTLLMHWLQLQSTPCEALASVWISFAWLYS